MTGISVMKREALSLLILHCLFVRLLLPMAQENWPIVAAADATEHIHSISESLPACSWLRQSLERGEHGTGREQLYMSAMRDQGVKRATFSVESSFQKGVATEPRRVVRRLYFSKYDGAYAQITNPEALQRFRESGFEEMLDATAIERVRNAPVFAGIEHVRRNLRGVHEVRAQVNFFDDSWLPEGITVNSPLRKGSPPLVTSAAAGDILDVANQLRGTVSKGVLNQALFLALTRRQDNTEVIEALVKAGADVNARDHGSTPLMWAIGDPCSITPLIRHGADVNARRRGRTILQIAEYEAPQDRLVTLSIQLLRQAGAR